MSWSKRLLLSAALVSALSTASWATRPIKTPAAEFPSWDLWINAKPLSLERLRNHRAVLIAFLNLSNVNSLRALKVLKALDEQYALSGLMVIGVLTPAYDFQSNPQPLRDAVRRHAITFPVVIDNDKKIWRSYQAEGWPHFYLLDHMGLIIYDALGEGRYADLESEIRTAIAEVPGYGAPASGPVAEEPQAKDCGAMTPEITLGQRARLINLDAEEIPESLLLVANRDGETSARGRWTADAHSLRLAQKNADHSGFLRIIYRGSQSFAVLGPAQGTTRFFVRQDDLWLHPGNAGRDVRFDDDGRSFVPANIARLYHLTSNPNDALHELVLIPAKIGAAVYDFSFSDACTQYDLP